MHVNDQWRLRLLAFYLPSKNQVQNLFQIENIVYELLRAPSVAQVWSAQRFSDAQSDI